MRASVGEPLRGIKARHVGRRPHRGRCECARKIRMHQVGA